MAYNAQAGSIPAYYPQGGASQAGEASYRQYQPYQYPAHDDAPEAYYGYDEPQPEPVASVAAVPLRARLGNFAGMLGAVASLALIAGVGIWSYELISRDISGVPVVRAVEGPMRVQPENPGGEDASHQGLAVNAVAATGGAEAPAERLVLAPEGVGVTDEDEPLKGLTQIETLAAALPDADAAAAGRQDEKVLQQGQIDALVAELTKDAEPLEPLAAPAVAPEGTDADGSVQLASAAAIPAIVPPAPLKPVPAVVPLAVDPALHNVPGVARSLRPVARPARFAPAADTAKPGQGRATLEVDATSLAAGTRLAQLGAYESADVARAEWDRIYGKFPDFLDGKQRVIQRAESGGRIFYRLRVMGFNDLADARRFCSALVAGRADCIPVTTR